MAATAATAVYSHVTKTPGVCGGKACIDNTRVRVMDVVWLHKEARTPEQIVAEYPDLTLEQVYAALSYYYGHKAEIEADFAREQEAAVDFDRRKAELLAHRTRE